jgi:hypothetical protein
MTNHGKIFESSFMSSKTNETTVVIKRFLEAHRERKKYIGGRIDETRATFRGHEPKKCLKKIATKCKLLHRLHHRPTASGLF